PDARPPAQGRRRPEDRRAVEEAVAPVGRVEARQAVEERRLAGAVRADEADDLPFVHVEGDRLERDDAAEANGEVTNGQDWHQAGVKRGILTSALTSSKVTRTGMPIASVAGSQPTRLVRTCTPSSSSTQARTYGSSSLNPRACVYSATAMLSRGSAWRPSDGCRACRPCRARVPPDSPLPGGRHTRHGAA